MYEIWSLGHKPFEDDDGREVQIAHLVYVFIPVYQMAEATFNVQN